MSLQTAFRLFHILAGICWVGAAVFMAGFLLPAARSVGPAAGPLMRELNVTKRIHVYMQVVSITTLLSGGLLVWRDAGPLGWRWFEHGSGLVYGIGAVAAIIASAIGGAVIGRAGKEIARIGAELAGARRGPSPHESAQLVALENRVLAGARAGALLLLVSSAAMAWARYL